MKIAIVGTAPSSRDLAPFNDPTWKFWVCSPGNYKIIPRADVWFEMHPRALLMHPDNRPWAEQYIPWLNRQGFPIYLLGPMPEIPRGLTYPLADVVAEFGPHFLTSSPAYMIALAIMQGATEIGIWGIDMAVKEEYEDQRPGCKFFILEAMRRGIKVHLPPQSDLMTLSPLYGYADESPMALKVAARKRELQDQMAAAERMIEEGKYKFAFFKGALDDLAYFERTWIDGHDSPSAQAQLCRVERPAPQKLNGAHPPQSTERHEQPEQIEDRV